MEEEESTPKSAARIHAESPCANPDIELPGFLFESDARIALSRLIDEDPLGIALRCARRLRERALLLCPLRLKLSTMARIALAAKSYSSSEPVAEWIGLAVDASIDDMLAEQREEERNGVPVPICPDAAFYFAFAEIVGIPSVDARLACALLNRMEYARRRLFHSVIVQGASVEAWAREAGKTPREGHELLRQIGLDVHRQLVKRRKARRRRA